MSVNAAGGVGHVTPETNTYFPPTFTARFPRYFENSAGMRPDFNREDLMNCLATIAICISTREDDRVLQEDFMEMASRFNWDLIEEDWKSLEEGSDKTRGSRFLQIFKTFHARLTPTST